MAKGMALVRTHRSTDLPGANRRVAGVSRRSPKGRGHGWPRQSHPWISFPAGYARDEAPFLFGGGGWPWFEPTVRPICPEQIKTAPAGPEGRAPGTGLAPPTPAPFSPSPGPCSGTSPPPARPTLRTSKMPSNTCVGQGGMIPLAPSSAGCYDSEVILNRMVEYP